MRARTTSTRPLLAATTLGLALALWLTGCWGGTGSDGEASAAPTSGSRTTSAAASATPPSAAPSSTPTSEAPVSPTPSPTTTDDDNPLLGHQASPVNVYWILEGDNGQAGTPIGCGDSLVMSSVQGLDPALTGAERVEAGIESLLAQREREIGERGLTNALYNSELTLQGAEIDGDTVTVNLSGQPLSAGTCDDPRIIEQLEQTALVNSGVTTASILVDGTPIREFMSAQG